LRCLDVYHRMWHTALRVGPVTVVILWGLSLGWLHPRRWTAHRRAGVAYLRVGWVVVVYYPRPARRGST
jgi:hypothetical protein